MTKPKPPRRPVAKQPEYWEFRDASFRALKAQINAVDEATGRLQVRPTADTVMLRIVDGPVGEGHHASSLATDINDAHACPPCL